MGRIRKWGSRRVVLPGSRRLGRLRLPKISWDGLPRPAWRSPAFKARPSRAGSLRPAARSAGFKARPSKPGLGWPAGQKTRSKQGSIYEGGTAPGSWTQGSVRSAGGLSVTQGSGGGIRGRGKLFGQSSGNGGSPARPRRRGRFWLILSLVLVIGILQGLRYVEQHLRPPIIHLAQIRVKQIATESINKAITSQVADGGDAEALIDWKTDKNGKISGFMLNYREHMRITSQAAEVIQTTLQDLHNRTEHIPLGQALDSPLIASFGPDVPIKIEPQGAVKVELNTRQKNAGINMILVEVYIHIVTEVAVVVPFDMEPQVVDTEIPVSYLMVVGDVPMYYYDNQGNPVGENGSSAPGIAIPAPSQSGDKSGAADSGTGAEAGNGSGADSGAGNSGKDAPAGSGNAVDPSSGADNAGSGGNAGNSGNAGGGTGE
ncbi:sporulation protein YunB [Paenibacillus typhae]|uniref:sporulation protein YunB n=1 Tax=Paenibacillus typhae TaxID=1174501 RepID=UPI001C8EC5A3|nr:sporulation protein YunB [Paenibacillus typhae]